jgi:NADPH:quinone reductase-like Zn-dependent oxidoreductase
VRAAYAKAINATDPLAGFVIGDRPDPTPPDGWTRVAVKAASLNHHDLWTLKGVGIKEDQLPMILGGDAAGIDESTGTPVVVHSVINTEGWTGDDTLDPGRTLLSEKHQGSLADFVIVPKRNVVAKPDELSYAEAACLPTAWLTAYRMLFTKSGLKPGQTVLVQGASGGVASACISMARAAGFKVYATARTEAKQELAQQFGAHQAFPTGARLPSKVDAVMETVGEATYGHSARSLRPGGRIVISGATSGPNPAAELNRFFFLQLEVVGSTMGTKAELQNLIAFLQTTGLRPIIDRVIPVEQAAEGLAAMESGDIVGKIVLEF